MVIFKLVKAALDELYAEGERYHGPALDDKIKEQMSYLSDAYSNLTVVNNPPISYRDPATRFAYVYTYVAAHGDFIMQILRDLRGAQTGPLFSGTNLRISCVGGGPGSDIVGVLKFLSKNSDEPVKKAVCYLLDAEQAWADTWTEVGDTLSSDLTLNVHFQPLDVRNPATWRFQRKFLDADIFTLSFFVSELFRFDDSCEVTTFWQTLFDGAKGGARFLYIDNGANTFNEYFDSRVRSRADIKCLKHQTNATMTPTSSEDKSELAVYTSKFSRMPSLKRKVSFRVLQKNG